jgi:hypothetical protein
MNAVLKNKKKDAQNIINLDILSIRELQAVLVEIDALNKRYKKNKTRPIIRTMILRHLHKKNIDL